ncbi:MAG: deoxyribose-phosphate aldolase, partial [Bacteroidales bacterium]|nr:deoxyribose-phosphate aldolase [Bacteroidales bacterium]
RPVDIEGKVDSVKGKIALWENKAVYSNVLGMIDLTSLTVSDTTSKIASMASKMRGFNSLYPDLPMPASICAYPNFAKTIATTRGGCDYHITVVGGCFPSSQSFLEVKIAECVRAVKDGADEVDIVLAHSAFNEGRYEDAAGEISAIGAAVRSENKNVVLKVILETGVLKDFEEIALASFLEMEAGADFIKTSTGKTEPAATPQAAFIMCECIKAFYKATGKKVGFKPAGGIATTEDAALY